VAGLPELLAWIESSALGMFMRNSGPWTYGLVNLGHILGISTLFGSILILDLHLLGLWRRVPLAALSRVTVPVSKVGFAVAAITGVSLLTANATEYIDNPFFAIKFPAIGLGLVNVWVLSRLSGWRARDHRELSRGEHRQLAIAGGISLGCWLSALSAGRMIGYW
jgi:hypothetical protein